MVPIRNPQSYYDSCLKWLDKLGFFQARPTALTHPGRAESKPSARTPQLVVGRDGRAPDALGRRLRNAKVQVGHLAKESAQPR